jgi:replicative superfamily II helicase
MLASTGILLTVFQVETSQSVIRIVGLSATLPNFIDVAEFLWSVSVYVKCRKVTQDAHQCLAL